MTQHDRLMEYYEGLQMIKCKFSRADFANTLLADWNADHFMAFIITETKRKFGVDYTPRAKFDDTLPWLTERSLLKEMQASLGNMLLRRFIGRCIENFDPNDKYLYPTVTYMWWCMRDELTRARTEVATK